MDPVTGAILAASITAAGSVGGGYLAGKSGQQKETKTQKRQRKLIDELISSLHGEGPYSDLYNTDEAAFQKSYVDPAKAIFRNQIAPQIQQQYIAGGQQRGTGLDDQLLRAGVDLDQLLNQSYLQFQSQGKDRMQNTINSVLNAGAGAPPKQSSGDIFSQATSGYLSSDAFSDAVSGITKQNTAAPAPQRKGFQDDLNQWNQQPRGLG